MSSILADNFEISAEINRIDEIEIEDFRVTLEMSRSNDLEMTKFLYCVH